MKTIFLIIFLIHFALSPHVIAKSHPHVIARNHAHVIAKSHPHVIARNHAHVIARSQRRRSNPEYTTLTIATELENQLIDSAFPELDKSEIIDDKICNGSLLSHCIMSSPYGPRQHPIFGYLRFHHGIDLAAKMGTQIVVPADGVVKYAGLSGGYGLTVTIDHGYGWVSRYAHLERIEVRRNEYVTSGEVVGVVGSTGLSTGPHLHFEVRYDGSPVDPRIYFPMLKSFRSLLAWKKIDPHHS